jgi:hypothetical protein
MRSAVIRPTFRAAAPALATVLAASGAAAQQATTPQITARDLRTRLEAIAHDSMRGRDTGSPELRKAADHIAAEMRRLGLRPAGDAGTYLQRVPLERTALTAHAFVRGAAGERPMPFAEIRAVSGMGGLPGAPRGAGEGPLVFGGYLADDRVTPAQELTAEQLRGATLILRMGAAPSGGTRPRFNPASLFGPSSPLSALILVGEGQIAPFWEYAEQQRNGSFTLPGQGGVMAGGGPAVFLMQPAEVERLIGRPLAGTTGPIHDLGTFRYTAAETRATVETHNVVAVLPGSDPRRAGQYVALGAHHDHVGVGVPVDGDSIYNGADDNGSGTVALMEIAEHMSTLPATRRPARSLLFVWHTAEEQGLLGSDFFTRNPTVPRDSIVAQLNTDMISRNHPDTLLVVGSRRLSTGLGDMVEAVNRRSARPMVLDYSWDAPNHPENIYCRSDHASYARFGIPVVFFFTGTHTDYHKPDDEAERVNFAKVARITTLLGDLAAEVANAPTRPAVDRPLPPLGAPCQ